MLAFNAKDSRMNYEGGRQSIDLFFSNIYTKIRQKMTRTPSRGWFISKVKNVNMTELLLLRRPVRISNERDKRVGILLTRRSIARSC